MSAPRYASVFSGQHPPTPEDFQRGLDAAQKEIRANGALSFTEAMTGKRQLVHIRCGRRLGNGRLCLRRAGHAGRPDGCAKDWEYP